MIPCHLWQKRCKAQDIDIDIAACGFVVFLINHYFHFLFSLLLSISTPSARCQRYSSYTTTYSNFPPISNTNMLPNRLLEGLRTSLHATFRRPSPPQELYRFLCISPNHCLYDCHWHLVYRECFATRKQLCSSLGIPFTKREVLYVLPFIYNFQKAACHHSELRIPLFSIGRESPVLNGCLKCELWG